MEDINLRSLAMKNEEVYENNSRASFIDKSPLFALLSNKINYVVDFERREHLGRFSAMNQRESSKKKSVEKISKYIRFRIISFKKYLCFLFRTIRLPFSHVFGVAQSNLQVRLLILGSRDVCHF